MVLNNLRRCFCTVNQRDVKKCVFTNAGHMLHHVNIGLKVKQCVHQIPAILMEATIQPITRTVLRVRLTITPDFRWNDQVTMATAAKAENNACFVFWHTCCILHWCT